MNGTRTWREIYLNKTASPAVGGSVDVSIYEEEKDVASKSFYIITAKGGNASDDMDAWDKSVTLESKDTWIPISYKLEGDSGNKSSLLPISELVVDPSRKTAIETYMKAFLEAHTPPTVESPMIVVDFMMKAAGTNKRKDGLPTSLIGKDPYGVQRWYYPMMANANAPADQGYAIETSGSDYYVVSDDDDHYWYYALGHVDKENNVYGITNIRFCEEGDAQGYTPRGDDVHTGIPTFPLLEKRCVHLKYADKDTKTENLIKAIGLQYFGDEDDSSDDKIIASTGGAEMTYPFGTDTRFEDYWKEGAFYVVGTQWWVGTAVHQKCDFRPVYSTKNLEVNFSFGDGNAKGQISHPKKWGE